MDDPPLTAARLRELLAGAPDGALVRIDGTIAVVVDADHMDGDVRLYPDRPLELETPR